MLDSGADAGVHDITGMTPLHLSVSETFLASGVFCYSADVKLRLTNAATYRFRDIRGHGQNLGPKFRIWGSSSGTVPKRAEDLPGTDMYHGAKFHADWCHRRQYICNRTENKRSK